MTKLHISHRANGSAILVLSFRPGSFHPSDALLIRDELRTQLRQSDTLITLYDAEVTTGPSPLGWLARLKLWFRKLTDPIEL